MSYFCNTVHKIAAAILLLAFLGQTFNQGFYYVGYVINKAEYMRNCENKYRPMLHCDGKCQLMKKIQAQQKKEQEQYPEMKLAAKAEVISSKSSFLLTVPQICITVEREYESGDTGAPVDRASSFFHPPNA
ncbi:MAG: hypothetical protein J0I32_07345 [Sphingobacteriales bacterium]|nr:hypothetical protein [Sphingobacteriales bacterium]OJW03643.1 MAG: hypothetical protein BGO52_15795 [Sphingobacteriales bacterium 44-61]